MQLFFCDWIIVMSFLGNYFGVFFQKWAITLKQVRIRNQVLFTIFLYLFLFKYCRVIMTLLEVRQGTQLYDPLLAIIPPMDFSLITFSLTYIALLTFWLSNIIHPKTFIIGLQAYCILIIMRTITIYLVPLEPPLGMILLKDPVTIIFMSTPNGGYIVKDLFFSGHVSAISLFYFVTTNIKIKRILLFLCVSVGTLILIQHVHYTIDVLAAPFFAYFAYFLSAKLYSYLHEFDANAIAN